MYKQWWTLLCLRPQALKVLRYSGLHPYVVFVASPRLERLHITRKMGSEKQKRRLGPSSQLDLDDPPVYTVRLYITTTHGLWIVAGGKRSCSSSL